MSSSSAPRRRGDVADAVRRLLACFGALALRAHPTRERALGERAAALSERARNRESQIDRRMRRCARGREIHRRGARGDRANARVLVSLARKTQTVRAPRGGLRVLVAERADQPGFARGIGDARERARRASSNGDVAARLELGRHELRATRILRRGERVQIRARVDARVLHDASAAFDPWLHAHRPRRPRARRKSRSSRRRDTLPNISVRPRRERRRARARRGSLRPRAPRFERAPPRAAGATRTSRRRRFGRPGPRAAGR